VTGGTLVVMPTYNEKDNLETAVRSVRACGMSVLVVDDNSPDGTGAIADGLAAEDEGVEVLHRSGKLGLGSAYVQGFQLGLAKGYDLFVEMDSDGSHKADHLRAIVGAAERSGGIGLGSRYVRGGLITGWSARRRFLSWGANVYCRALLGLNVHDCTSGFRCYPRRVLEAIELERVISDGYSFQVEMLYRAVKLGFPVTEVPIHFEDRVAGASKVSGGEIWTDFFSVLRLRLRRE
jgi:glycosyltransferase involved in cell wall biosynthesis